MAAAMAWGVESEAVVRSLAPDCQRLATVPARGVIVTSRSEDPRFDFVSRFFAPASGVNEDPVTGSAHCSPYKEPSPSAASWPTPTPTLSCPTWSAR